MGVSGEERSCALRSAGDELGFGEHLLRMSARTLRSRKTGAVDLRRVAPAISMPALGYAGSAEVVPYLSASRMGRSGTYLLVPFLARSVEAGLESGSDKIIDRRGLSTHRIVDVGTGCRDATPGTMHRGRRNAFGLRSAPARVRGQYALCWLWHVTRSQGMSWERKTG